MTNDKMYNECRDVYDCVDGEKAKIAILNTRNLVSAIGGAIDKLQHEINNEELNMNRKELLVNEMKMLFAKMDYYNTKIYLLNKWIGKTK